MIASLLLCALSDAVWGPREVDLDKVAALTGVRFPDSATLIEATHTPGPRPYLEAEISLPEADRESFMDSVPVEGEWTREDADHLPGQGDLLNGTGRWSATVIPPRVPPERWCPESLKIVDVFVDAPERASEPCTVRVVAGGS